MSETLRKTKDKASKAFVENRLKDALKLYQQVIDEDPTEIACRIKIGDIHRKLGQKREAIQAYEPVARHYAEDGLLLKAIAVCKLILGVDGAHTATQEMLANLYAKREGRHAYVPRTTPGTEGLAYAASAVTGDVGFSPSTRMLDLEDFDGPASDELPKAEPSAPRAAPARPAPAIAGWPVGGPSAARPEPKVVLGVKAEPPREPSSEPRIVLGTKVEPTAPRPVLAGWPVQAAKAAKAEAAKAEPTRAEAPTARPVIAGWPVPSAGQGPKPSAAASPVAPPVVAGWPVPARTPSKAESEALAEAERAVAAVAEELAVEVSIESEIEAPLAPTALEAGPLAAAEEGALLGDEPLVLDAPEPVPGVPVFGALEADGIVFAEDEAPIGEAPAEGAGIELSAASLVDLDERDLVPDRTAELEAAAVEPAPRTGDLVRGAGLPQIPLFSDLPKDAFISVLVEMPMRELSRGARVITQGEIGDSFFVIATGRVRVERKSEDGTPTVLAYLTDGAFFGEMALLQDGARVASVIVEEDSQIFEIRRELLQRIVAQYPSVDRVVRNFYMQRLLSTTMATHPLFRSFGVVERRRLMARFKVRPFKAGDVLLKEEQKGEGLYLLLTGRVEVTKVRDGEPLMIAELGAGDMFGEISLLTNKPTVATVTATSDCLVLRLSKRDFDEVIMTHPQVLELVAKVSEERQTENSAILSAWTPRAEGGAALV